jgi:hypothetical protein
MLLVARLPEIDSLESDSSIEIPTWRSFALIASARAVEWPSRNNALCAGRMTVPVKLIRPKQQFVRDRTR